MSVEWNPENMINQLMEKQQFYAINSVLTNKVLDCDEMNGNLLCLNKRQKGKDSQEFTLIKKDDGYLIQSKVGGYLTRFKQGNQEKLYLDKKVKNPELQTFKLCSNVGMKGERIETLDKKAIGTFGKQSERQNWTDVILAEQNSEQNQIWNFIDSNA